MRSNQSRPGVISRVVTYESDVLRLLLVGIIAFFLGTGCSGEGGGTVGFLPDEGGTDSNPTDVADIATDLSDSGPVDIGSDEGPDITDEGSDITDAGGGNCSSFAETVQPVLMQYCVGCHTASGLGGHNVASSYADAVLPASSAHPECADMNVGECSLELAKSGAMPPTSQQVSSEDLAILQAWVDAGTPEDSYDCVGEDAGGGTDEGSTDEGSTDAGGTDEGTADQGATDEGSADEGTVDQGGTDEGSMGLITYDDHVKSILMLYCSGCHTASGLGGHNIAAVYDDANLDADGGHSECYNMNIGECSVELAIAGVMPPGSNNVSAEHIAILQQWLLDGMLESDP